MTHRSDLDHWNSRFAGEDYVFGTEPNRFLAAQAPRLPRRGRALTIADGEGRNGVWLARQGLEVTSVEFAPAAIAKARRLADQQGVSLDIVQADLATWDWGAPRFDVVAGIFFQFAGPDLRDVIFRRMQEVLLPGGLLLIEGYTPAQLRHGTGGPSQVENLYTEALLRDAFAGMEILHLAEYETDLREGSRHAGRSAVIDLVACRPMG
ncbi:Class I SAM-dependent methyltransferase [Rhodovastum atsumiense]|uniref:Class I SAM-dependent methyltransferase n=1 Tax=Rhodovastum atsumiense TaxID=504468 RepID=A0A5M6J3F2_9PROT|nr:class I SAM-dependent methyltransferase [Rhodovastum atsumiense]KAA5614138.1 class I SAM-dependent methyltransferase [Rhodovastum atsumiense]CAH2598988.1 Class I SAM-dependent methyltransferase [Rhodovastum atsumiense]